MFKRSFLFVTFVMALAFPRFAIASDTIKLACFGGMDFPFKSGVSVLIKQFYRTTFVPV